jgi:hypothetical protein
MKSLFLSNSVIIDSNQANPTVDTAAAKSSRYRIEDKNGGNKMKKLLSVFILSALAIAVPNSTMAGVDISIGFSLPPPIVFAAPPEVIVVPDTTDVYVVPDIDAELFFWNGWWWRLWEGRWYHSRYYDRGWVYYDWVPSFYFNVDPGWRRYYRDRSWRGYRWDYERIPYWRLRRNWDTWHRNRYWERQRSWGIQNYQHRHPHEWEELRNQWRDEYHRRPEVQRHQREIEERRRLQPQRQPRVDKTRTQQQLHQQRQQRHRLPRVEQPERQRPERKHQQIYQQRQRQDRLRRVEKPERQQSQRRRQEIRKQERQPQPGQSWGQQPDRQQQPRFQLALQ